MAQFRHATIALALLAGTSAASAQTTVITREPVETQTVVTTQPTLVLTPQQRQTIYRDIARERVVPAPGTVTYSVGTRVPSEVRLYSVPDSVAVEVPAVRQYRYMMVNGRVVLVDPATSEVVAELAD
ncbi:MAG TPA: DUF1236 domain-containing protein [Pseudolabrys sp.]|nr:DUF1236 domain-containing protein [Pseudolabrys sp.]